ncbi:MAG TPA: enoyl-CoA hydratase, partial [Gammaproteobacteria bacterium]|nr:enoyl-CoA hydratase [Gammaproteobacteria bacterium]
ASCTHLIHRARDSAMTPALPQERERFVALFTSDDQREGVRAFLEKREPRWRNT